MGGIWKEIPKKKEKKEKEGKIDQKNFTNKSE